MHSSDIYKVLDLCVEMKRKKMFTASTDEKKKLGFGISQLRKSTSTLHEHWGDIIRPLPLRQQLKLTA